MVRGTAEIRMVRGESEVGDAPGRGWVVDLPASAGGGEIEIELVLRVKASEADVAGSPIGFTLAEAVKVAEALGYRPHVLIQESSGSRT